MVCYVAHRCYCQLVRGFEGSYVVSCWKYDVCFNQREASGAEVREVGAFASVKIVWKLGQSVAAVAEAREVGVFARVKIVWKLCQRLAVVAEAIEIGARACVKTVWKLCQSVAAFAEVGEVCIRLFPCIRLRRCCKQARRNPSGFSTWQYRR